MIAFKFLYSHFHFIQFTCCAVCFNSCPVCFQLVQCHFVKFHITPLPILLDTLLVTTHCHLSATYIMCRYSPQYRLCCRHHALLGSASTMFVYSNPSRHIQADNILPSLSRFNAYIYCTPLIPIISTGIQYLLFATAFAVDE